MDARNVWLIFYLFVAAEVIMVWSFFLHNYYSNNPNWFNAIISPTSESVWEHTKLIIYPFLFIFLILLAIFSIKGKVVNGPLALLLATVSGVVSMILIYYLIEMGKSDNRDLRSMIIGHLVNLLIAVVLGLIIMYAFLTKQDQGPMKNRIALMIYVLLIIITSIWSYQTPCDCFVWKKPQLNI